MPIHARIQTVFCFPFASRVLLFAALLGLLGACATTLQQPNALAEAKGAQAGDSATARWWYVRFRLRRGADDEVQSYLDTLIADQILAPVIARHEAQIGLWRFHRRWPRDATGHQFSFIFFAPRGVAGSVVAQIEQQPGLARLRSDSHLVEFRVDEAESDRATDPAATSDASWPPEVQREWPKFIMGASRMWLGLVRSEAAKHGEHELHARYRAVEDALAEVWFTEANHAFFHHLSALFGYKPVRVIRREIMTF
jgi:hypothetical protein